MIKWCIWILTGFPFFFMSDPCMIPRTELESQKVEVKDEIDAPENIFVQRGLSIELTCTRGYVLAANSSQSAFVIHCDGTPPEIPKCKGDFKINKLIL